MPTRKIRDIDPCDKRFHPCQSREHLPPSMMVFQPGEYEHECPACGHITHFTVYPHHWLTAKQSLKMTRDAYAVDMGWASNRKQSCI